MQLNYTQLPLDLGGNFTWDEPLKKKLAVLHYGMGFDSSAILLDYLENPDNWDFIIVCILIAQTGNESNLIREQVETFVFPRIREHQIRTIQIAKISHYKKDGYTVLDDTISPTICYYRPMLEKPYFSLSDEMLRAGSVPQFARKRRSCSHKFKGEILDAWHDRNCPGCLKLIGYNADEQHRIDRANEIADIATLHPDYYPLNEKGWGRDKVVERVYQAIKSRRFYRSACLICPFQFVAGSNEEVMFKYEADPLDAAKTAYLEFISVCFNPRQTLSSTEKTLAERGMLNPLIEELLELELSLATWKVFEVRRIRSLKRPYRSVKGIFSGSRAEAQEHLSQLADKHNGFTYCKHGIGRVYRDTLPGCEQFYVAAPSDPIDKERPGFASQWQRIAQQANEHQIELL